MYERIEIWLRRDDKQLRRYQCLRRLTDSMFAVQNADTFEEPTSKDDSRIRDFMFIELLLETDPSERCEWFKSPEAAIAQHDLDFA